MASSPLPALFHGKEGENAQNFLRSTEAYFLINRITDEAVKVALFSALISAGSQADYWWTNLDVAHKSTWTLVKTAFENKWPTIAAVGKTKLEYQKELLVLRLKDEDIGERTTSAEVTMWSHIHFHNQLQMLVQDAGVVNAPVLIHQVRDALPRTLRDLTTPAPPDWNTFLNEIKDVNVDILQDKAKWAKERKEAERAQNAHIARLEGRQHDSVEILPLQMQQASLGTNNSPPPRTSSTTTLQTQVPGNFVHQTLGPRRPIRYTSASQAPTGQRMMRGPPTQEEKDALRARINDLPHHTDTEAGHVAYQEQLRQWATRWGEGARCTENTPFPLMPGAVQICSGECFRCGAHGHIGPACELPPEAQLLKSETIWRGICMRTLGTFNRATAPQVNYMLEEVYTPDAAEQGKGNGSSA
ncbi:hypothetical protein EV702DRAFT_1248390 [Suillus placidus]|uniref:CCHC-type domain-containing protein n=1 Tax=Suillus placidus TaxID=48579 RepID=A0A9P7D715_9AGAM|nr:hypothetical protein EV702DRAFT_1248390 [Suillus placidus]